MANNKEKVTVNKNLIEGIIMDKELIFKIFFDLLNRDLIVERDCLSKFDELLSSYNSKFQKFFLLKIKLFLISKINKKDGEESKETNTEETKEISTEETKESSKTEIKENSNEENNIINEINECIRNDDLLTQLKEDKTKNLEEKNLEDIILDLIKYLINKIYVEKNYREAKKRWTKLGINLENFTINERMKDNLYKFFKDEKIPENFKDISFKDKKPIMEQIYGVIEFGCNAENRKILEHNSKSIKQLGDKQRDKDDDGKNANLMEESCYEKIGDVFNRKIPDEKRELLFEKFTIEINLNDETNPYNFYIGIKTDENKKPTKLDSLYENYIYDSTKIKEKNFMRYLTFWYQVKDHIELIKNEINLKTIVTLELTIKSRSQSEETLCREEKRRDKIKDYYDVKCLSYFRYNGENFVFLDQNVLVYGINGKIPGLVFLFNELCNEDYKN